MVGRLQHRAFVSSIIHRQWGSPHSFVFSSHAVCCKLLSHAADFSTACETTRAQQDTIQYLPHRQHHRPHQYPHRRHQLPNCHNPPATIHLPPCCSLKTNTRRTWNLHRKKCLGRRASAYLSGIQVPNLDGTPHNLTVIRYIP